jgi:hypothetical protein
VVDTLYSLKINEDMTKIHSISNRLYTALKKTHEGTRKLFTISVLHKVFRVPVQYLRRLLRRSFAAENVNSIFSDSPLFPNYNVFTLIDITFIY